MLGPGIALFPRLQPPQRHNPRLYWVKAHFQTATNNPLLWLQKVLQTRMNKELWRVLRFKTV
jgi:hypothetical protein